MSEQQAGSLMTPPADDVPALLEACRQRVLEREGIAMFVALNDSRPGRTLQVQDPSTLTEAARLAELFDHYRDGLVDDPTATAPEEDPTGARGLINVLVVLSDWHLRAPDEVGAS